MLFGPIDPQNCQCRQVASSDGTDSSVGCSSGGSDTRSSSSDTPTYGDSAPSPVSSASGGGGDNADGSASTGRLTVWAGCLFRQVGQLDSSTVRQTAHCDGLSRCAARHIGHLVEMSTLADLKSRL